MAKRHLNRRQSWRIEKIQEERAERALRRESKIVDALEGGDLGLEQTGQIIAHFGVQVDVEAAEPAGRIVRCHLRANLPALVTGDRVVWRMGNQGDGVIVAQLPRTSALCRPDSRGLLKPVAANVDRIVIVFAALPEPHGNLIDRYLVAAENAGIQPILLLNKADLLDELNSAPIDRLLNIYRALDYPLMEVSASDGLGLAPLQTLLDDHISVFVGQSGVGKSSLINALLPGVDIRTGALSELTQKGTHTTTTARLFHFPAGGDLIDSPGIREFGLTHISRDSVTQGFIEFRPFLGHCKFRDCSHEHEPGCALLAAVKEGRISALRMDSYRRIIHTLPSSAD